MEERDILLKTIESLNASIQTLSENHKKEVESLNARIKELTAQVAWLNRQLFGRKSEKLPIIDPNYPDLFAGMLPENAQQIADAHDEAVEKIVKTKEECRQEKKNRIMMEDLPVLEQVILTPDNLDKTLYKKIGQEVTRIVEHKPGQLYIKEGQYLRSPQWNERRADCPHAPAAYLQGNRRCQSACRDPAPEI